MNDEFFLEPDISTEVLNIVDAVILVMDRDGRIVLFNKAAETMTGYTFEEVKYKAPWDLFIPDEQIDEIKTVFSQLTAGHYPNRHTNYWLSKDKTSHLIDWSNTVITDENGNIAYVIGTGIDVTDKTSAEIDIQYHINKLEEIVSKRTAALTRANTKLEHLAHIDGLTNIFNRRYFDEIIEKEIERAKRSNTPLSLLMCDVDFFKNYNDTYGHVEGDKCLKKVAAVLNNFFSRAADFVARYGGEEFVVLLPGIESQTALGLANKLIVEIQNCKLAHDSSSVSKVATISIGLATNRPEELTNGTALINAADKALYLAKEKGRNRVQLYSVEN